MTLLSAAAAAGGWDDRRVELLKKMWSEGLSGSQIAVRLGGITRMAVIGKAHRLGLAPREKHRFRSRGQKREIRALKQLYFKKNQKIAVQLSREARALRELRGRLPLRIVPEPDIPLPDRRSLETIGDNECRWPIGDPKHSFPEFYFCGKSRVIGLSYCEHHALRAFDVPKGEGRQES